MVTHWVYDDACDNQGSQPLTMSYTMATQLCSSLEGVSPVHLKLEPSRLSIVKWFGDSGWFDLGYIFLN